jgi:hypothetical protein
MAYGWPNIHRIFFTGARPGFPFSDFSNSGSSIDNSFAQAFVVTRTNNVPFAEIDCGEVTAAICGPTNCRHSGMIPACSIRSAIPLRSITFATIFPIASGRRFRSVMR